MKKLLATLLALVMALSMAACGPTQDNEPKNPGTDAPATEPAASEPASNEPAANEPVLEGELNYWTMWNDTEPQGEAMQAIADAFEAKFPGTKINITFVGRDLSKTLKAALESNQDIDFFEYPSQYGNQLVSFCADLTDVIDQPFESLDGKTIREVVLPSMLEAPKTVLGIEENITVGYKPYQVLMMYNASAFDAAGITGAPKTWAELDEACAKLLAAGFSPLTFDDAYAAFLPGMYLNRAMGTEKVLELMQDTTGDMWKDEAVVNMAKAFEDFATKGYFDANVGGNKWPAGQMDVGSGKAAMYLNLTGLPTEVKDVTGPDFKWGAFNFPDVVEGATDAAHKAPGGATAQAINAKCDNMALATEFLAFMHSAESDARMVEAGMTTSRVDGDWPEALTGVIDTFNAIDTILPDAGGVSSNGDVKPILAENFIQLAAGKMTADQFIENMVAATAQ